MLVINKQLIEAMQVQAQKDHPIETCGVIAGPEGSNLPLRFIPMRNAAQSETFFQFDPQEQLVVWQDMEAKGEEPVVIFHSHTHSRAYPSRTDIEFASEPDSHYVIIPTLAVYGEDIRSFRIVDGMVTEERVQTVGDYQASTPLRLEACA